MARYVRLRHCYALLSLLAIVGYLWAPDNLVQMIWYDGVAMASIVAIAAGIHRNRPRAPGMWWLLAAGQAATVVGDLIFFAQDRILHLVVFPSPADPPYLLAYILQSIGLLLMVRRRTPGKDWASLIDSLIISGAFGLLSWTFLLQPVVQDTSLSPLGQAVTFSYPALDLLLLALVAWLLAGGGRQGTAFSLMAASFTAILVSDGLWAFVNNTQYTPGHLLDRSIDCGYLTGYTLLGLAALHPAMTTVNEPTTGDHIRRVTNTRFGLLTTATLMAPGLLAWTTVHHEHDHNWAVIIGSTTMFLLVVTRMVLLVRQVESQTIALRQQAQQMAAMAEQDPLTGLPNRRAWNTALTLALDRARSGRAPVSLAIIDLDHFKQYNDAYGHPAGDRLLKEATAAWLANLRPVDLLARYGGEEFTILIAGRDEETSTRLIDRLHRATPAGCTFSAGVASWNHAETADELLARADLALYRAKQRGRDRTEVAHDPESEPITTHGGSR